MSVSIAADALGNALLGDGAVELTQEASTSCSVFQDMPLPPLPSFVHQRTERGELLVGIRDNRARPRSG
jgi:hypothetical protein